MPLMEARRVSTVARSPRGFLTAYRAARGRLASLPPDWLAAREAFIARHGAQLRRRFVERGDAALWETSGRWKGTPTRQHLALIAWACPFYA